MKELTKAEEQVMQYLWQLEKGFLKDIVDSFPEPKPANTTVSTVIRILVNKGAVGYEKYGPANQYFPLLSKKEYSGAHMRGLVKNYFNNSYQKFASFFTNESGMTLTELEELKQIVEKQIDAKKRDKSNVD